MDLILDLDLDFFVWPIAHMRGGSARLSPDDCQYIASEEAVRSFLEQQCHLKRDAPLRGQMLVHHDEAFFVWRRWLEEGSLKAPFAVTHVDAHADQGMGDAGWHYLLTELLALPVDERSSPKTGNAGLTAGNYLMFAIANRWLHSLTYVYPIDPFPRPEPGGSWDDSVGRFEGTTTDLLRYLRRNDKTEEQTDPAHVTDLMTIHFRNDDWRTNVIELRCYPRDIDIFSTKLPEAIHTEHAVPFTLTAANQFNASEFTHIVVAQSPAFTPAAADELLPIMNRYFTPS